MDDEQELSSLFRRSEEFSRLNLRPEKVLQLPLPDAPETQNRWMEPPMFSEPTNIDLGVLEETPRSDARRKSYDDRTE